MSESLFDIPILNPEMAATELTLPVTKWGTRGRKGEMPGTWHFYADDYKFAKLLKHPGRLPMTGCKAAIEPNLSTWPGMPLYEAIAVIGRKRAAARRWQTLGIRIIVDLDVEPKFRKLALLGVPDGWPAYATRVHRDYGLDAVMDDWRQAIQHSGLDRPFFVLVGGGKDAKQMGKAMGWHWIPEHRQVVAGLEPPYGTR